MNEEEYLMISGLQHFDFCRRQWALIHIEQLWEENALTVEGHLIHRICDDGSQNEKRNNIITMRALRVNSHELGLSGICDVVEFYESDDGIELNDYIGKWQPVPVEYKHGHSKVIDADRLQLCAQGMALEEMFVCSIQFGFMFYHETRRREKVEFNEDLRDKVRKMSKEMHNFYCRGWTPSVRITKKCKNCSLSDLCLPELDNKRNVALYINDRIRE